MSVFRIFAILAVLSTGVTVQVCAEATEGTKPMHGEVKTTLHKHRSTRALAVAEKKKDPKKPNGKKSPKKPGTSSKTPSTPSKPFGAITEAAKCQLYVSWAQMLKGSSCDETAKNSVDCFAGYGEKNTEMVSRLCPAVPKRVIKNGSCVSYMQSKGFKKVAENYCKASLGFDLEEDAGCKKKSPSGKKCVCYNACIDYVTLESGFASNGGTCCQNLCDEPVTTTTTTPPPTTAR